MSKLKIGLYLAAIFAAGFVTGVFVTVQVARHMMPDQAQMAAYRKAYPLYRELYPALKPGFDKVAQ